MAVAAIHPLGRAETAPLGAGRAPLSQRPTDAKGRRKLLRRLRRSRSPEVGGRREPERLAGAGREP